MIRVISYLIMWLTFSEDIGYNSRIIPRRAQPARGRFLDLLCEHYRWSDDAQWKDTQDEERSSRFNITIFRIQVLNSNNLKSSKQILNNLRRTPCYSYQGCKGQQVNYRSLCSCSTYYNSGWIGLYYMQLKLVTI